MSPTRRALETRCSPNKLYTIVLEKLFLLKLFFNDQIFASSDTQSHEIVFFFGDLWSCRPVNLCVSDWQRRVLCSAPEKLRNRTSVSANTTQISSETRVNQYISRLIEARQTESNMAELHFITLMYKDSEQEHRVRVDCTSQAFIRTHKTLLYNTTTTPSAYTLMELITQTKCFQIMLSKHPRSTLL